MVGWRLGFIAVRWLEEVASSDIKSLLSWRRKVARCRCRASTESSAFDIYKWQAFAAGIDDVSYREFSIVSLQRQQLNRYPIQIQKSESIVNRRLGCSILEDDVWKIELQELPEASEFIEKMKLDGGSAITHVGRLIRKDNRSFSISSGTKALGKLYLFLSFVRGGWTPPLLCVGLNREADRIYEDWGQRLATPWEGRTSWFDVHHGEWMAKLYPGFVQLLDDAAMGKAVSSALYWYLRSNRGGAGFGIDSGIILSQAALERLSTAYLGVRRMATPKNENAAQRLREMMRLLKIPRTIPRETSYLRVEKRKQRWSDGPEALTRVRNELIHPGRLKLKIGKVVPDIWRLARWYFELIVLRLAAYDGDYSNRLKSRWVGEFEPVPWATRRAKRT